MPEDRPLTGNMRPDGEALDRAAYERVGGYQGLRKALGGMTPAAVIDEVKASNLRGRGGAGFSTGLNGVLFRQRRRIRGMWWPTAMRWSLARSRTGCWWSAILISWWRA